MVGSTQRVGGDGSAREQGIYDVHRFANIHCFRSATTEELVGNGDPLRRPIRPEDVFLLDFTEPLNANDVLGLGGLIGHRTLLNAYEIQRLWPPTNGATHDLDQEFYSANTATLAADAKRQLEPYLFDHLTKVAPLRDRISLTELTDLLHNEQDALQRSYQSIASRIANRPDLRDFVFIQDSGLYQSRRTATELAMARGALLGRQAAGLLSSGTLSHERMSATLSERGLDTADHNYWQFYLSSAIGCVNLLYRYANVPRDAGVLTGVFLYHALCSSVRDQVLLDLPGDASSGRSIAELLADDSASIATQFGDDVVAKMVSGFFAAKMQWQHFFDDLGAQLNWLANIDAYSDIAQRIKATIDSSDENVDLDTFVETLDMCSTTHVHDEHRLVVIESGKMVFWANAGMELRLDEGEMTLVPINRLHGSSIETPKCTYHQPIIEPGWLERHGISLDEQTST